MQHYIKKYYIFVWMLILINASAIAQDSTVNEQGQKFTLTDAIVRNHFDYKGILQRIKEDTSFYKAFKTLRTIGYSSYNHIEMKDKNEAVVATLNSKTKQTRKNNCRSMEVLEETTTGDLRNASGEYNYVTPSLYASLFFTKGTICGETNVVAGKKRIVQGSRMEKAKEQLKMLFFNPGKKIPGIPFIGNKLDLYDESAHELYDYKLDYVDYHGQLAYVFDVQPKQDLGFFNKERVVVDQMITWFNPKTLEVLGRNYSLSYKAGVYDFNVQMEVEMTYFNGQLVPKILRYKGNWDVVFKKRERGLFTATLFDYKAGE
jgi:Skp family chaperone for outer membrane proteins